MISYDNNVEALATQLYAISVYLPHNNYKMTLKTLMDALEKANKSRNYEIKGIKNPSHGIISFIQYLKKKNGEITLNAKEVERYKLILAETKDNDAIDLIPYIQSLLAWRNAIITSNESKSMNIAIGQAPDINAQISMTMFINSKADNITNRKFLSTLL